MTLTGKPLDGSVALVTGGAGGLGGAIVAALANAGAAVVALDLDGAPPDAVEADPSAPGPIAVRADVRDAAGIGEAVDLAVNTYGSIDILVNNAGVATSAPIVEMSEDEWDLVLDVNLKGTFLTTRAVLPHMLRQGSGAIVNVSSREGKRGAPFIAHYCAAKAGVINFTRALALEAAPSVRANCLCPGVVDTPMLQETLAAQAREVGADPAPLRDEWVAQIPLKRMQSPEAIAGAVLFLASDDAAQITGQALSVDGGSVMA